MPTFIGHSISGIAVSALFVSRPYIVRVSLLCIICAILPDLDAIGFRLGIPYQHWLGHRGFSHSILFAIIIALIATLFILDIERSPKKRILLFAAFFVSVLAHDILDAMTNGGLGVAFFSPFSEERLFLPWHPIEVSPLSLMRLFSSRGMTVMASEFIWVIIPSLCIIALASGRRKRYEHKKSQQ